MICSVRLDYDILRGESMPEARVLIVTADDDLAEEIIDFWFKNYSDITTVAKTIQDAYDAFSDPASALRIVVIDRRTPDSNEDDNISGRPDFQPASNFVGQVKNTEWRGKLLAASREDAIFLRGCDGLLTFSQIQMLTYVIGKYLDR